MELYISTNCSALRGNGRNKKYPELAFQIIFDANALSASIQLERPITATPKAVGRFPQKRGASQSCDVEPFSNDWLTTRAAATTGRWWRRTLFARFGRSQVKMVALGNEHLCCCRIIIILMGLPHTKKSFSCKEILLQGRRLRQETKNCERLWQTKATDLTEYTKTQIRSSNLIHRSSYLVRRRCQ